MKKDAKIGLSIILGAVLLSALLIGKALQSRDHQPVKIPGEASSREDTSATPAELSSGSQVPAEDDGDTSMNRLIEGDASGSDSEAGPALAAPSTSEGADSGSAGAGGSETFGHSGALPEGSTTESSGASNDGGAEGTESTEGAVAGYTGSSEGASAAAEGGSEAGSAESSGAGTASSGGAGTSGGSSGGWAPPGGGADGASAGAGRVSAGGTGTTSATYESSSVTPTAGSDFTYAVQEGDSAWKISKRFFSSGAHWKKIVKANPGVSFSNLKVGTKLTIPGKVGATAAAPGTGTAGGGVAIASEPAAGTRIHRVVRGDSLYKIAKKYLGSGMRYREIAKLNPDVSPSALRVGQKLKIPTR